MHSQNLLRIQLTGEVADPIMRMTVDPEEFGFDLVDAFRYERFL